jgi:hypothetical protein
MKMSRGKRCEVGGQDDRRLYQSSAADRIRSDQEADAPTCFDPRNPAFVAPRD